MDHAITLECRCRHAEGTLAGEGGDAITPIMIKFLHDDTAGLAPDFGSYTNVDIDQGIADFVGTSPGAFGTDFAVTERPLTTAEAAAAKANGRSFAYVPIAAIPVALMTLVPSSSYQGASTIAPGQTSASTSRSRWTSWTAYTEPHRIQVGTTAG